MLCAKRLTKPLMRLVL